jgi:hypothetical protein
LRFGLCARRSLTRQFLEDRRTRPTIAAIEYIACFNRLCQVRHSQLMHRHRARMQAQSGSCPLRRLCQRTGLSLAQGVQDGRWCAWTGEGFDSSRKSTFGACRRNAASVADRLFGTLRQALERTEAALDRTFGNECMCDEIGRRAGIIAACEFIANRIDRVDRVRNDTRH